MKVCYVHKIYIFWDVSLTLPEYKESFLHGLAVVCVKGNKVLKFVWPVRLEWCCIVRSINHSLLCSWGSFCCSLLSVFLRWYLGLIWSAMDSRYWKIFIFFILCMVVCLDVIQKPAFYSRQVVEEHSNLNQCFASEDDPPVQQWGRSCKFEVHPPTLHSGRIGGWEYTNSKVQTNLKLLRISDVIYYWMWYAFFYCIQDALLQFLKRHL